MPCILSFAYKKVIGRLATRNLPVLLAAACGQGGKAGHEEVQPMYTRALNINSKGFTVAQVQVVFLTGAPQKILSTDVQVPMAITSKLIMFWGAPL